MNDITRIDALVVRARKGEDDAFAQLHELFADRLMGLILKKMQAYRIASADKGRDDFLNSTMASFHKFIQKGTPIEAKTLFGLLATIARRKLVDFLNAKKNQARRNHVSTGALDLASENLDPALEAIDNETAAKMARLQGIELEVLNLWIEECTVEQMAAKVGQSPRTVQRTKRNILKKFED